LQILQLYHKLHSNDGVDQPEPLNIVLHSSIRYSVRIGHLLEAAEASKGYAELLGWTQDDLGHEEAHDADFAPANDDSNGVSEVADYEGQVESTFDDSHDPPSLFTEEEHEADDGNDEEHAIKDRNGEDHGIVEKQKDANENLPSALNGSNAPSASEDGYIDEADEIDYADAENGISSPPGGETTNLTTTENKIHTPSQSIGADTIGNDITAHLGHGLDAFDYDAASDFHIDIFGADDDGEQLSGADKDHLPVASNRRDAQKLNKPETPQEGSDLNEPPGGEEDFTVEIEGVLSEDEFADVSEEKAVGHVADANADEEDELIDWDEDEEEVTPKASGGSGLNNGSPLGKRNREDHAESIAEADVGQG
jgi:hypothetical protein